MPASIVRGCAVVTEPVGRRQWRQIADGAVLQRDGVVAEIGPFAELAARHPHVLVIGSGRHIVLPGFVNGHHHIGLTPLQHGSPGMPLELWFVTRLVMRRVDLYLDTLYSAFEMIASGITTVQHLHGWLPGDLAAVEAGADAVIRAYRDIGMRVSYSFALRDQNRLVYRDDAEFTAGLPAELRPALARHFARFPLSLADYGALFEHLHARYRDQERVAILDRIAATGTYICHDCSSNFRLRSGLAPLNAFEKRGINTAIGLDEAGINDDRDIITARVRADSGRHQPPSVTPTSRPMP
jgi:5-methylthioadenosine/S-adenosylhomocysteine deaminase